MSDRFVTAFRAILNALLPTLANFGHWEYRVTEVLPGPPVLISGVPVSVNCPFGNLARITLWPGPTGGYATPAIGSRVLVAFVDGDPQKPRIAGLDPNSTPVLTTLAGGGPAIARSGDTVTITQAELTAATAQAGGNPVTIAAPLQCQITSGSTKAVCG
jgi:hypothetical protein